MRVDPMDEWCSNCDRVGHSEPRCPYRECSDCDGHGDYSDGEECETCNGEGYITLIPPEPDHASAAQAERRQMGII